MDDELRVCGGDATSLVLSVVGQHVYVYLSLVSRYWVNIFVCSF